MSIYFRLSDLSLEELIWSSEEHVEEMINEGMTREKILLHLASVAERLSGPESTVSILYLDEDGLLRNGSSPKLPEDYIAAIDRLRPDPHIGTFAAVAATGEIVMTPDFYADEKWAELRQLPLGLGYIAVWCAPIKSSQNVVLGTFGTYFRNRRHPTEEEIIAVQKLAQAAALVLAKKY